MSKQLEGKTILITGATHGLGKMIAQKVSAMGAELILIARNEKALQKIKTEIELSKVKVTTYVCDLRNPENIKSVVTEIINKHDIDILINNAGIWTEEELEKTRPELRKAALETNVLGHIELTETLLPYFKKRNSGHIFNVISTSGASDTPDGDNSLWRTYGASKWAMRGYTNALISLFKGTEIKVTGFYPGGFDSDIFETAGNIDPHAQPWMMKTEDVADVAIFTLTRPSDILVETIVVTKK